MSKEKVCHGNDLSYTEATFRELIDFDRLTVVSWDAGHKPREPA